MFHRRAITLILLAALAPTAAAVQGGDADGTRSVFVGSRPSARKPARRPVWGRAARTHPRVGPKAGTVLTLGYSLLRYESGRWVTADTAMTFRTGDRLRLALEPGVDGYVYVFSTANDGSPTMLYPDRRLDGGANYVEAHSPVEVPSRRNPLLDCLMLVGAPAVEHFYIVLSLDPVAGVPSAAKLTRGWAPRPAVWSAILAQTDAPSRVSVGSSGDALRGAGSLDFALARDVVLASTDEQPQVVAASAPGARSLVRIIAVAHE